MASDYSPRAVGGVNAALTADSGSVQAGATLCDAGINVVGTVGTIGDSLLLPAEVGQKQSITIVNTAANSADVFPNVGATINGGSADAAFALAGGAGANFIQVGTDGLTWVVA